MCYHIQLNNQHHCYYALLVFQIENVIYVSFAHTSYLVIEDIGSFPITLRTDRPPPKSFSVGLQSMNGNARCESHVVKDCLFYLAAAMNV